MALSVGSAGTKQVEVTGDNGLNYTPLCSYDSSDPTKATISASGLISGVAPGSSTITATYLPAGATEELTVSDTLTVS